MSHRLLAAVTASITVLASVPAIAADYSSDHTTPTKRPAQSESIDMQLRQSCLLGVFAIKQKARERAPKYKGQVIPGYKRQIDAVYTENRARCIRISTKEG